MNVCGVSLKGNEAIFVAVEGSIDDYQVKASDSIKIKLNDSDDQSSVQHFTLEVHQYLKKMNFDLIGIKERGKKGRFAGGPVSFKIEGILQNEPYPVSLWHVATIKSKLKNITVDTDEVKAYQEEGLQIAVVLLKEAKI